MTGALFPVLSLPILNHNLLTSKKPDGSSAPLQRRKGASVRTSDEKNHDARSWDLARGVASRNKHTQRAAPPSPPPMQAAAGGRGRGRGDVGGSHASGSQGLNIGSPSGSMQTAMKPKHHRENRSSGEKPTVPASRRAPTSRATRRQRLGRCSQLLYVSRAENG